MNDFPQEPNHEFYKQFDDPQRAYSNLPALVKYYRENPDIPRPEGELDHIPHAWDKAHENDQPAAFPLIWTPDGLQYDFSASESAPVQPNLF